MGPFSKLVEQLFCLCLDIFQEEGVPDSKTFEEIFFLPIQAVLLHRGLSLIKGATPSSLNHQSTISADRFSECLQSRKSVVCSLHRAACSAWCEV